MQIEKKISLSGIYMVVFLDILGFGIIIPIIRDMTITLADFSQLKFNYAVLSGILMSSYSLAQFICAPLLGSLSDRYGRKKILFISVLGNVVSYLMWAISQDYYFFLASRLISGMTGGNISVAQSYIADVTKKEDRAKSMGMFGATIGLGFVIGPFLGGYLSTFDMTKINHIANLITFNRFGVIGLACASLSVINLLMITFNLKDSIKGSRSQPIVWNLFRQISLKDVSKELKYLIVINFFHSCSFVFLEATLAWDLLKKFNLDAKNTGLVFACMGLLLVFVQGGIYRVLQKKFALEKIMKWGFIITCIFFGIYSFQENIIAFYLCLTAITFGLGMVDPSISALISLKAEKNRKGLSMGLMQSFASLARTVVPFTATLLYDYVHHSLPGLIASLFVVCSLMILTLKVRSCHTAS